jgi:hypothetical protein
MQINSNFRHSAYVQKTVLPLDQMSTFRPKGYGSISTQRGDRGGRAHQIFVSNVYAGGAYA